MKLRSVFIVFLFSITLIAQTPFEKGTYNLNGSLSFSSQSYEGGSDNLDILTFNPQVGYFVGENFSLGLSLSYVNISLANSESTTLGIGPSFRFYLHSERTIKPFFSLGYSYTESSNSSNKEKVIGTQFIITGGFDYFITSNVALETTISYMLNNEKFPNSYKYYYKSLTQKSKTFLIGFGVNYFIY